jgi:hypothetical protein
MMSNGELKGWAVVDGHYPGFVEVKGSSFKLSVVISANDITLAKHCQRLADAHLISATPDLLEALELYMAAGHGKSTHFGDQAGAYSKAVAAIAKAKRGKSNGND